VDLSQQSITDHQFDLNRRGYDPDAVDAHLGEIAAAVTAKEDEVAALKRTVAELQAKVRDADESEEALRLTLKAAAHAKEELLTGARDQAAAIEREAEEKAGRLIADAEANAAAITEQAQARAQAMTSGASAQAREVARAALSESELLVVRIEQLRAQVGAAEESLRALSTDAGQRLDETRGALDKALESARASAENPELLAAASGPPVAPAQDVPGQDAAQATDSPPTSAPESPAPAAEGVTPEQQPVAPVAAEEGGDAGGEGEPAATAAGTGESHTEAEAGQDQETSDQPAAESSADISDKVDRLLEELREVT
jgi:DivIVA domain-containing protein